MREKRSAAVQRYLRAKRDRADALIPPLAVATTRRYKLGLELSGCRKESVFHKGLGKLLKSIILADVTITSLNDERLSISKEVSRAKNFLRKKRQ